MRGIEGIALDGIYYCPHHTEGIKKQYNIDLTQSLMIGGSAVDMLAGKSVGCTCILIRNNDDADLFVDATECIDYKVQNLLEAAQRVLLH